MPVKPEAVSDAGVKIPLVLVSNVTVVVTLSLSVSVIVTVAKGEIVALSLTA